jgi:hypothetical protein
MYHAYYEIVSVSRGRGKVGVYVKWNLWLLGRYVYSYLIHNSALELTCWDWVGNAGAIVSDGVRFLTRLCR